MNLYKLHNKPEELIYYRLSDDRVPILFWDKYEDDPVELKYREHSIAESAKYSYWYANDVLDDRFELGEPAIAKDTKYSYWYARDVLDDRFELGEPAIAKNAEFSYWYARFQVQGRFELGEDAISKDKYHSGLYREFMGNIKAYTGNY